MRLMTVEMTAALAWNNAGKTGHFKLINDSQHRAGLAGRQKSANIHAHRPWRLPPCQAALQRGRPPLPTKTIGEDGQNWSQMSKAKAGRCFSLHQPLPRHRRTPRSTLHRSQGKRLPCSEGGWCAPHDQELELLCGHARSGQSRSPRLHQKHHQDDHDRRPSWRAGSRAAGRVRLAAQIGDTRSNI
jgi:hypothetical protein